MTGAAGYMALVLAEVGRLARVPLAQPPWNEVKRGFFTLTTAILLVLATGAWLSTRAASIPETIPVDGPRR